MCLQEEFDLDVCDYLLSHLHDDLEPSTSAELSLMDEDDVERASLPHNKDRSSSSSSFHGNRISAPGTTEDATSPPPHTPSRLTVSHHDTHTTARTHARTMYNRPGKYGWMVMDVDGKAYRLNSGLFVASRYPLEAPEFVQPEGLEMRAFPRNSLAIAPLLASPRNQTTDVRGADVPGPF